jgi:hypothetical protein
LLDLTLEAAKGVFESFALLKLYFCQTNYTSPLDQDSRAFTWSFGEPTIRILTGRPEKFLRYTQKVLIS